MKPLFELWKNEKIAEMKKEINDTDKAIKSLPNAESRYAKDLKAMKKGYEQSLAVWEGLKRD